MPNLERAFEGKLQPLESSLSGDYPSNVNDKDAAIWSCRRNSFPPWKLFPKGMEWATMHRDELLEDWELARKRSELKKNISFGVTAMFMIDVVDVKVIEGYLLELIFDDGLTAKVDMDRVLGRFDGVFAPLCDPDFFNRVRVDRELGTIVWPNGADICPDVLYSFASGKPIIVNGDRVMN
jgi:hypothetical protein